MSVSLSISPENTLPGFGEAPTNISTEKSFVDLFQQKTGIHSRVAVYALIVIASIAAGTVCGGVKGAAIGAAASIGAILINELIKFIWKTIFPSPHLLLPSNVLDQIPETDIKLGAPTTANIRLAADAVMAFEWKKKLCESANESIEISPNFVGGARFREFLQVIEKRMAEKPNLKVHMLCAKELIEPEDLDYINQLKMNPNFNCIVKSAEIQHDLTTQENHVKLLVVDGKYFTVGGNGISDHMTCEIASPDYKPKNPANKYLMPTSFRDTDIIGEGAIATKMRSEFFKLYSLWEQRTTGTTESHYFPLVEEAVIHEEFEADEGLFKNVKISLFVSGPEHQTENAITNLYHEQILSAENNIMIANSQFMPNAKITKSLMDKKNEVTIRGIFNRNVQPLMIVLPTRSNYGPFHSVHEYDQGNRMYHKKIMTIDNKRVIIGSYNMSQKSDRLDNEIAVLIDDEQFAIGVNQMLQEDIEESKAYDTQKIGAKIYKVIGGLMASIFKNYT